MSWRRGRPETYSDNDVPRLSGWHSPGLEPIELSIEPHVMTPELLERLEVMKAAMRAVPIDWDKVPSLLESDQERAGRQALNDG